MAAPITDINQLDMDATYTVADYLSWQFDEMVQLIRGKVVRMSPAPKDIHASVSLRLVTAIAPVLRGHPCTLRYAPYDVYLPTPGGKPTVVQPDILIVCDKNKIQEKGCVGAPDWICEIVSPGSFKLDTITKKQVYQEAGVQEYLIVHPGDKIVEVYRLGPSGTFLEPDVYTRPDEAWDSVAVPGVKLAFEDVFSD